MKGYVLGAIACLIAGCAGQAGNQPLENTYWKLTQVDGAPVAAVERQREAHFILHPADRRVSGSGGCNGIGGNYELAGDRLTFGRMIRTMMACETGMDTENRFLAALSRARKAAVSGQQLQLLDADGKALARFEAMHPR